jgi:hypothetical protein
MRAFNSSAGSLEVPTTAASMLTFERSQSSGVKWIHNSAARPSPWQSRTTSFGAEQRSTTTSRSRRRGAATSIKNRLPGCQGAPCTQPDGPNIPVQLRHSSTLQKICQRSSGWQTAIDLCSTLTSIPTVNLLSLKIKGPDALFVVRLAYQAYYPKIMRRAATARSQSARPTSICVTSLTCCVLIPLARMFCSASRFVTSSAVNPG